MLNYYQRLEVPRDATQKEIRKAYLRKATTCHPDKVANKEEDFLVLQEAYATLGDREKRSCYDVRVLRDCNNYKARFKRENNQYFLSESPQDDDHYTYYNKLFSLAGDEKIGPGKPLEINYLYEKIDAVSYILQKELVNDLRKKQRRLKSKCKELCDKDKKRMALIDINVDKICFVQLVLFSHRRRQLYDLSLGVYHDSDLEELKAIEVEVGGKIALSKLIQQSPDMYFTTAIFTLHESHCLTPANFNKLKRAQHRDFVDISSLLKKLHDTDLLNQRNFDFLMRYIMQGRKSVACKIAFGVSKLKKAALLNQENFEMIVRAGKNARNIGTTLATLQDFGILTKENYHTAVHRLPNTCLFPYLNKMTKANQLTPSKAAILLWNGPPALGKLNHHINEMFAHGLFLLSCMPEKGKVAMLLAMDLKSDLKSFMELPQKKQVAQQNEFASSFMAKLHSKDDIMSVHREAWKTITANICLALTGLGLVAISINYLLKGTCFFAQTKGEKLIETVEKSALVAIGG